MAERRVLSLKDILTWKDYYAANVKSLNQLRPNATISKSLFAGGFPPFQPDDEINTKVSIHEGDITDLEIDGIVNAANSSLLGGGGVDGAIHSAAGSQLLEECRTLCGCQTGDAKTTCGYKLPARYVVHTVGPQGIHPKDLRSCYSRCLEEMMARNMRTLAFCCISTGIYGYPNDLAVHVALNTVREWLGELKKKDQLHLVDRIIFCLSDESNVGFYKTWLQEYFPILETDSKDEIVLDKTDSKQGQVNAGNEGKNPANVKKSSYKTVARLLLPGSMIRVVIGQGGEDIERLRTDFTARSTVLGGKGPEGILKIEGTIAEISDVIMDVSRSISFNINDEDEDADICLRILFNKTCAEFISRNPTTLPTLMINTGTQVKLFPDCAPYSSERVLEIDGEPVKIGSCIKSVLKMLKNVPPKGANMPYNQNNFDQVNSTSYGGYTDDGDSRGSSTTSVGINGRENEDGMRACEVWLSKESAKAFTDQYLNLVQQETRATINRKCFKSGDYRLFVTGTQEQCRITHYLLHLHLMRYAQKAT